MSIYNILMFIYYINRKVKKYMQLTLEDRKTIERLLKEREELKKKNVNIYEQKEYYTDEEVWGLILEQFYKDIQDYI